jgi:hypothetical protein
MAKARRMTNTLSVFQAASPLASRGAAPPLPDRRRPLLPDRRRPLLPDSHGRRCRTAHGRRCGLALGCGLAPRIVRKILNSKLAIRSVSIYR